MALTGNRLTTWLCLLLPCVVLGVDMLATTAAVATTVVNVHPVEGYADRLSVAPGESIQFFVHMPSGHHHYAVTYSRYGSSDASGASDPTVVAGPVDYFNGIRQDYDSTAATDGAGWQPSFSFQIPAGWSSGLYAANITDDDATPTKTFNVTFVVRDVPGHEKNIALLASTNTWAAYNPWPTGGAFYNTECPLNGATYGLNDVSFARPNPAADPRPRNLDCGTSGTSDAYTTEHLAAGEERVARWLEQHDHPYSMLTDWDVDQDPGLLDPSVFSTVILSTHSEYWSEPMYDALESYLDAGGNVISLSGNAIWRVVSIDPSTDTMSRVPPLDPFATYSRADSWPYQFPFSDANVLGISSIYNNAGGDATAWSQCAPYSVISPTHWIFQSTGVGSGTSIGDTGELSEATGSEACDLGAQPSPGSTPPFPYGASGWEVDRADPPFTRSYQIVAKGENCTADQQLCGGADMITMQRASAGQVLAVGSIMFGQSLVTDGTLSTMLDNAISRFSAPSFSDFDSDGIPDLVARDSAGDLQLFHGTGSPSDPYQSPGQTFGTGWNAATWLGAPGDMDGDGHADLIARNSNGDLTLFRGTGSGAVLNGVNVGTGWNAARLIATPGDMNGDGRPDLVAIDTLGNLLFYAGAGDGGVENPINVGSGWGTVDWLGGCGDLNQDGYADLVSRDTAGDLWLYFGTGDGQVRSAAQRIGVGWGAFSAIACAGDPSRDGHGDLLTVDGAGKLWLYPNAGPVPSASLYPTGLPEPSPRQAGGFLPPSLIGTGWSGGQLLTPVW